MKVLFFCCFALVAFPLFSQSKKDLQAEVEKLQGVVAQLNNEIVELRKPIEPDLNDSTKQVSYCFGVVIASNMKNTGLDSLDMQTFLIAMQDVFSDKTLKVEPTEAQYMHQVMIRKSAVVKEQGMKFLEANKAKEGVKTTASGLQYKILTQGQGKSPGITDRVTVHYTGKLVDGTVFDSSIQRGQPSTFRVNQVIPGWTEALRLMKEGDKWIVYVPYSLGYGERGYPPQIPPFATLIFEVELLKVN